MLTKNKLIAIVFIIFMIFTTIITFNALKGIPDTFEAGDIWIDE